MNREQKERLAQAGWKVGTASELLGLSKAEEALGRRSIEPGRVRALG
jgi:hypothetical protein